VLTLTHASLATTEQLFRYKSNGFKLDEFPGYTPDQWGIKAHNRPWIEAAGNFSSGQSVMEIGGAYSLLPKYLGDEYGVEAWIGDDYGAGSDDEMWSRWGDPHALPEKYPSVKYVFEPMGKFDEKYPNGYFDCVFSVSTLEHIPYESRLDVFRDMNRCLKPGGRQLHSIDLSTDWRKVALSSVVDNLPGVNRVNWIGQSEIRSWVNIIKKSGVKISANVPNPIRLFDRRVLVESPDVVYRFYPPNNEPKRYDPGASLLVIIEDQ
jgi:SAM-dependent methyltransferase